MDNKLSRVLSGALEPNIFPFLWLHGEDEATLREYMGVIYNAECRAVCLESRPHPDFLGPGWWRDLDILLDEARYRGMKVWILDDGHFPTGWAGGALRGANLSLRRKFITRTIIESGEPVPPSAPPWRPGRFERGLNPPTIGRDTVVSVAELPGGHRAVCHVTYDRGPHRDYINMLSRDSCRVLLGTVYEAHYSHYKDDFGKTIAGFFSDEPELGNDHLYEYGKRLWELDDLLWSDELEELLRQKWGKDFERNLPLLWEPSGEVTAKARYAYMDCVTGLVSKNFSEQIGSWCREHGVEYIGHIIEDNNQHTRTGSSLGHYFRGLAGQDMAGIDCIGNQVLPQGEWNGCAGPWGDFRDGLFYHYVLGKLGASAAKLDPKKHGRCMCEIFGNYGWSEGVRLEKYLADHFLVRGVNRFVPHAFDPASYPDMDCPPHFYAHGHNPQYRHFGELVKYMSRMSTLLDGGRSVAPVAILYNAAAEWTGDYLDLQALAQPLFDRQIDYDFIPEDVVSGENEALLAGYQLILIPGTQYIPLKAARELMALSALGSVIWFVGRRPKALCDGDGDFDWSGFPLVAPEELGDRAVGCVTGCARLIPKNDRIRALHYRSGADIWFFVNEGTTPWRGTLNIPAIGNMCEYDGWENKLYRVVSRSVPGGTEIVAEIVPGKSLCLVFGDADGPVYSRPDLKKYKKDDLSGLWRRSVCRSIDYPHFSGEKAVCLPDDLASERPDFSGFVRYERTVLYGGGESLLEITDAQEGVEVFVNGTSAGIQIAPPFLYNLTGLLRPGENELAVEVATTLERETATLRGAYPEGYKIPVSALSGITGKVWLYTKSEQQGE